MSFDSRQRRLLEGEAGRLYDEVVESGWISTKDERLVPGSEMAAAFALLCDLGLLAAAGEGRWSAVDPTLVQAQVVAPMGQRGAELIAESAQWASALGPLAQ